MKCAIPISVEEDTPHTCGSNKLSQWWIDINRSSLSTLSSSSRIASRNNRGKLSLSPGYKVFSVRRGVSKSSEIHYHEIVIDGDEFFVDGGSVEKRDDPKYAEFLKSIENYGCPEEFEEDGVHSISVFVGFGGYNLGVKGMHDPIARRERFEKFIAASTKKSTGTGAAYYGF